MKWITAKKEYRGSDPETGEDFHLLEGESREVSDAKAEQLERDFPDDFKIGTKKPKGVKEPAEGNPPPPGGSGDDEVPTHEQRIEQLNDLKRGELNEIAEDLNIADPAKFENIGVIAQVIAQVEARKAALTDSEREDLNEVAESWDIDHSDVSDDDLVNAIIAAETAKLHESE